MSGKGASRVPPMEIFQGSNSNSSTTPTMDNYAKYLTTEFNTGTPSTMLEDETPSLNVVYAASEVVVAILAITGNLLVVYVFCTNRSLRRYRNYYVVGLAVADFLVGLLGIPLAILASIGLPSNSLYGCLFSVSILMVLCTISILCLLAVSIDRYWATNNPFAYYRNMTTSTSIGIILSCWIVGAIIGFLPLFGWYNQEGWHNQSHCYFTKVMDYSYIVFIYFTTIVFPALLMACFYGYIYHIVLIKIRQKGTLAPAGARRQSEASRSGSLNSDLRDSTQMMRVMVSEKRREGKAAKKLSIIVLFFMICWMPLYTINCVQAFCSTCLVPMEVLNFTIILSHANSAMNPFLYAYHLKEFRSAMRNALYALASRLSCGVVQDTIPKEVSLSVSRTLTMPSIAANATKSSIKVRKVTNAKIQSPNGHHPMVTSPSRATLLRPVVSDKSISSSSALSVKSRESVTYQLKESDEAPGQESSPQSDIRVTSSSSPDVKVVCQRVIVREYENRRMNSRLEEVDAEELIVQWNLRDDE